MKLKGRVEELVDAMGYHQRLPLADAHLCCGSAGTYSILQPELAGQLVPPLAALEEKPHVIVTANIGCMTHLASGTSRPVRHWVEPLDEPDARHAARALAMNARRARRQRARISRSLSTRWMDNDTYGHVNNVVYYAYFDTVVNEHLIRVGGLDIHGGGAMGVVVETRCHFRASLAFPDIVDAGLVVRAGHRR